MSSKRSTLGSCPRCGTGIPDHRLLIEYETTEGTSIFAECPSCEDVVTPA